MKPNNCIEYSKYMDFIAKLWLIVQGEGKK